MNTKLLFLLSLTLLSLKVNTQNIGFLGDFNEWGNDVNMSTTDFITFTLDDYYLPTTGLKFRQDDDWANNWGGDTFPTGFWSSNNIPVTAGFYNISIDIGSTEYIFTPTAPSNQNISLIGDFNSWSDDLILTTTDFINYSATNVPLTSGGVKFRRNGNWSVNFGGTTLDGIGIANSGDNIPIPADGNYDITFNIDTLAYTIQTATLSNDEYLKNINIYFADKLYIKGYHGKINLSVYDIFGRQIIGNSYIIETNFSKTLNLQKQQFYIITIEGKNFKKTIKAIAK